MATQIAMALLSLYAYNASTDNELLLPPWTQIQDRTEGTQGFAYAVFRNSSTNDVVIAFRGSDDGADWLTNAGLVTAQERQAATVYAQVLRDYGADAQGSNISFTGHSLGGGLAATMAVWFDQPAVVFDPSPTQAVATDTAVVNSVIGMLGSAAPQSLKDYALAVTTQFALRENNVASYFAPGSAVYAFSTEANTITGAGQGTPIQFGIAEMDTVLGRVNMHAQALLTAGLLTPAFAQATIATQRALPVIFDGNLYDLNPKGADRNFLLDLIRSEQQSPGNSKLTHFAADLQKLGTNIAGLNQAAQNALIAQGIEWYYWQSTNYAGQEFLTAATGVLQYTTAKGADLLGAQNKAAPYVGAWLESQGAVQNGSIVRNNVNSDLYQQWTVAVNNGATASAQDTQKTQIFVGSSGNDSYTGGQQADLLLGGDGNDTLIGGVGEDKLYGGAGTDSYVFGDQFGKDVIWDADGQGLIGIDGQTLGQAKAAGQRNVWTAKLDSGQVVGLSVYDDASSATGKKLVITRAGSTANTITINHFDVAAAQGDNGYLGITLQKEIQLVVSPTGDAAVAQGNPFEAWDFDPNTFVGSATTSNSKGFVVYLNQAAKAGATLVLHLGDLAGQGIKAILGDQEVDADGATITLAEGQTQVSFALVQGADLDTDATGSLTVSFQQDAETATGNAWNLTWTADTDPVHTFAGDDPQHDSNKDNLTGSADADLIQGLTDSDALFGLGSDDKVEGGLAGDVLMGGLGADTLIGGDGDDVVYGSSTGSFAGGYTPTTRPIIRAQGDGWDYSADAEPDEDGFLKSYLSQTIQRDIQQGDAGNSIDGGSGDDVVFAGTGGDLVRGGDGKDDILGMAGDDVLLGDAGNDRIYGDGDNDPATVTYTPPEQQGADFIDGGLGNDILLGQGGNDAVYGGADNDRIWGDDRSPYNTPSSAHGEDYLDGEDGDDTIVGGGKNDDLRGGAGNDELWADDSYINNTNPEDHGDDYADGGDGDDSMWGGGRNDVLYGGIGNDVLYGDDPLSERTPEAFHGEDYLDGEEGADSLVGGAKGDLLFGGAGNDVLWGDDGGHAVGELGALDPGSDGDDYLDGEDGDDQLIGEGGNDELFGGIGNDLLKGDDDASHLPGEFHGNDYLDGEEGMDSLVGGGGDDELFGGADNDQINGDAASLPGSDHGNDYLDGEEGEDALAGGGGNDTLFGGAGNDSLAGDLDGLDSSFHGADYLDGEDGDDTIDGQGGNDRLFGGIGADSMIGGAGDDEISGEDGNDSVWGGEGADSIFGNAGDDQLVGDTGDDYAAGGEGNDRMWGGSGNDVMDGDTGLDTLSGGDGADTLDGGDDADKLYGGADNDVLGGGGGDDILQADVGDDQLGGGGGHDTLSGGDGNDQLFGDSGDDLLQGGIGDDWLQGGDGIDYLAGGAGNDTLIDDGVDVLDGGLGNDTYVFDVSNGNSALQLSYGDTEGANNIRVIGASADSLTLVPTGPLDFSSPIDLNDLTLDTGCGLIRMQGLLTGAIGTVEVDGRTYGASEFFGQTFIYGMDQSAADSGASLQGGRAEDTLTATGGYSTLAGGAGNDTLTGSGGHNTYRYYLSDGVDTITDSSTPLDAGGQPQGGTLMFGAGLNAADIKLSSDNGALVISFGADQANAARITGFNAGDAAQATGVIRFAFADGTELTHAELVQRGFDITGTNADETLRGTNLADRLAGGGGSDTLIAAAGADTYTFNLGDGWDVISDGDAVAGSGDALRFGDGILPGAVVAVRSGTGGVALVIGDGSDRVTLTDYFSGGANAVEDIEFADGTTWTQADVYSVLQGATEGNDEVVGDDGDNTLDGRGGNDIVSGLGGNDLLIGGTGSDTLHGGLGNDTFVFNTGDRLDAISDGDAIAGSGDTPRFGEGIWPGSVVAVRSGTYKVQVAVDAEQHFIGAHSCHNVATGMTPCWDKMFVSKFTRKLGPLSPWSNTTFDIFSCNQIYDGAATSAPHVWRGAKVQNITTKTERAQRLAPRQSRRTTPRWHARKRCPSGKSA